MNALQIWTRHREMGSFTIVFGTILVCNVDSHKMMKRCRKCGDPLSEAAEIDRTPIGDWDAHRQAKLTERLSHGTLLGH